MEMNILTVAEPNTTILSITALIKVNAYPEMVGNNDFNSFCWNAVTGEIRKLNSFRFTDSKTEIPVKLKGGESIFIVFADKINTSNEELSFEIGRA